MNRHTVLGALVGLLAGAAVILLVVVVGATREDAGAGAETAHRIRVAQKSNTRLLHLLKSCTVKPSGRCQAAQQASTRLFLEALARQRNQALAYALACVEQPGAQSPAQIRRCIAAGLRQHDR